MPANSRVQQQLSMPPAAAGSAADSPGSLSPLPPLVQAVADR
jgi:hypothetical protein